MVPSRSTQWLARACLVVSRAPRASWTLGVSKVPMGEGLAMSQTFQDLLALA